jgi:hypothetical protein
VPLLQVAMPSRGGSGRSGHGCGSNAFAPPVPGMTGGAKKRGEAAAQAESLACAACKTNKPPSGFSRSMCKAAVDRRRCLECVAASQQKAKEARQAELEVRTSVGAAERTSRKVAAGRQRHALPADPSAAAVAAAAAVDAADTAAATSLASPARSSRKGGGRKGRRGKGKGGKGKAARVTLDSATTVVWDESTAPAPTDPPSSGSGDADDTVAAAEAAAVAMWEEVVETEMSELFASQASWSQRDRLVTQSANRLSFDVGLETVVQLQDLETQAQQGQTGGVVWDSAVLLSRLIAAHGVDALGEPYHGLHAHGTTHTICLLFLSAPAGRLRLSLLS